MNSHTGRGRGGFVCLLLLGLLLAGCAPRIPAKPLTAAKPLSPAGSELPGAPESGPATPGTPATAASQVVAGESAAPGSFDGDLRELPAVPNAEREEKAGDGEKAPEAQRPAAAGAAAGATAQRDAPVAPNLPALGQNFAGLGKNDSCNGQPCGAGYPPDTVGDVGPNHYIQAVNTAYGVFSKTGNKLASFTFNSLFSAGPASPCQTQNQGDPTVVYDPMGDRWILADFAFTNSGGSISGPFYECIAVSKTGDPLAGGWWLYAINVSATQLPDYPKMAIWPDGLYISYNMFTSTYQGIRIQALNRAGLESGATVIPQTVDTGRNGNQFTEFTLLPVNLRGAAPPVGTPAYFVGESLTDWAWDVFKFSVNWSDSTQSSFTGPTHVLQSQYDYPGTAGSTDIIPQSTSPDLLDSLGDRLMMQAQYRRIGSQESIWVAHTVRPLNSGNSPTAIHWAELNVTGGVVAGSSKQEQIFTNGGDGLYRWTPSIAVDQAGNALVGYSASNSTQDPTIRLAGRLTSDPASTLGQGETTVSTPSTGAQRLTCGGAACARWGDYSGMSVDPVDDCTFWYTNEFYATTGSLSWQTRIVSLKFPSCGAAPAPALSLAKSAQPGTYSQAGAQIVYTYALQNTGNVSLAGPALVTDDKLGAAFACGVAPLAAGQSASCTRTYTVTQADVDNGSVRNTASASMTYNGQAVRSGPATATVDAVQTPRLGLTKTANRTRFNQAGDQIVYGYTVFNAGNVTLAGPFSVSDDHRGTALTCTTGSLAPGASTSCQWTYTVTVADASQGSVVNRATASGSFAGQAVVSPAAIWVALSNGVAKETFLPLLGR